MGLFNYFFGVDQAALDAQDAKLRELNLRDLESGIYSKSVYDQAERNRAAGVIDANGQIQDAFVEGAKEGLNAEADLVAGTLNGTLGLIWRALPWWIWLAGLVALFFYFG